MAAQRPRPTGRFERLTVKAPGFAGGYLLEHLRHLMLLLDEPSAPGATFVPLATGTHATDPSLRPSNC